MVRRELIDFAPDYQGRMKAGRDRGHCALVIGARLQSRVPKEAIDLRRADDVRPFLFGEHPDYYVPSRRAVRTTKRQNGNRRAA